jgi:hypothetical protein
VLGLFLLSFMPASFYEHVSTELLCYFYMFVFQWVITAENKHTSCLQLVTAHRRIVLTFSFKTICPAIHFAFVCTNVYNFFSSKILFAV